MILISVIDGWMERMLYDYGTGVQYHNGILLLYDFDNQCLISLTKMTAVLVYSMITQRDGVI